MRAALLGNLAQYLTIIGDHFGAANASNEAYPAPIRERADFTGGSAQDAVEAIVEASRERRVVMLNESHSDGRCRAFGEQVAVALAREGFSVFAAEAFQQGLDGLADDGVIDINDGYYLADPLFANIVRAVSARRYRTVAYEQRDGQEAPAGSAQSAVIEAREIAQASNLIAALKASPEARVFVYCGPGHLSKLPSSRGDLWFAARFKSLSGIDPLTIEQSDGLPNIAPDRDDPRTAGVVMAFKPEWPVVVREADGRLLATEAGARMGADISVFHPRQQLHQGRPSWLDFGGRRAVKVDLRKLGSNGLRLLQAVPSAELTKASSATPADQYLLDPDADWGRLWLKPGRYSARVETPGGFQSLGEITV